MVQIYGIEFAIILLTTCSNCLRKYSVCTKLNLLTKFHYHFQHYHQSNGCVEIYQDVLYTQNPIKLIIKSASIDYHTEDANLNHEFNHDLDLCMNFSRQVYHYLLLERRHLSEQINKWQELIESQSLQAEHGTEQHSQSEFVDSCTQLDEELTSKLTQSNDFRQKLRTVFTNNIVFVPLILIK